MNVSFGAIRTFYESPHLTVKQSCINHAIKSAFAQEDNPYSENHKTIETLLEDNKDADVFIKNKDDGSVDLEIRKNAIGDFQGFVPYSIQGTRRLRKLNIKLPDTSRKSLMDLGRNLDRFALQCRAYALTPDTPKNRNLAEISNENFARILRHTEKMGVYEEE